MAVTDHPSVRAFLDGYGTNRERATFNAGTDASRIPYRSVAVLGGGTAGYLTALALRRHFPSLRVAVLESPRVPIIGVGEATTDGMVPFLHHFLGIDIVEFYREVRPTWKLGIMFDWGAPEDRRFAAPFEWSQNDVGVLGSLATTGGINEWTTQSMLMCEDRTPVLRMDGGEIVSLLPRMRFGLHLDNARFVGFLTRKAAERGIEHIDCHVADAARAEDGTVTHLVTTDGRQLAFDLFVDCSGFRSFLLEDKLGSPFVSFDSSLFTDTAVTFNLAHDGHLKPYTTAMTMNAGWCWIIPTPDADHLGYVHSARFCSADRAMDEIAERFGVRPDDARVVRFRCGRHRDFWLGNVVAIGNSYGFVEPLESSGLYMITEGIMALVRGMPRSSRDDESKRLLSAWIGGQWDKLRWFLALHFKFNNRYDTPYWRAARADTDISGAADMLQLFEQRGPLSLQHRRFLRTIASDSVPFYGFAGFDCVLLGQGLRGAAQSAMADPSWWERRSRARAIVDRGLPQAEALRLVSESPELLRRITDDPEGWLIEDAQLLYD